MIGKNVNVQSWETNLFHAIENLADLEFQRETWTGKNPQLISSYIEIINVLFDDNGFIDYIDYYKSLNGADNLYNLFIELVNMIDNYNGQENDELILNDPSWIAITNKAKQIVPLLHYTTPFQPREKG